MWLAHKKNQSNFFLFEIMSLFNLSIYFSSFFRKTSNLFYSFLCFFISIPENNIKMVHKIPELVVVVIWGLLVLVSPLIVVETSIEMIIVGVVEEEIVVAVDGNTGFSSGLPILNHPNSVGKWPINGQKNITQELLSVV